MTSQYERRPIRIVLLDSGIEQGHVLFREECIVQYQEINKEWSRVEDYTPLHGHGTGVASIIKKHAEQVEFTSFVLFSEKLSVKVERLISALNKIVDNVPCDIVHMSLGVRYYHPALKAVCERLAQTGVLLVAACHNNGGVSFPAAFPCVIGVDTSWKCLKADDFVCVEHGTAVNLKAKGGNQRIAWLGNTFVINRGSSFAAPYVTAQIAKFLVRGISSDQIMGKFREISRHVISFPCTSEEKENLDSVQRAIVFPYNKETSSLLRYADLLDFELTDIFDIRLSGKLAKPIYAGNGRMETALLPFWLKAFLPTD